jgi:hypothetical protein
MDSSSALAVSGLTPAILLHARREPRRREAPVMARRDQAASGTVASACDGVKMSASTQWWTFAQQCLGTVAICAIIQGVKPHSIKTASSKSAPAAALPDTAVKTKAWLERDGRFVIGDGGLRLLLGILEHGSLLAAARQIRWSYRHAWGYLRRAEAALGMPLTEPRTGQGRLTRHGADRGGAARDRAARRDPQPIDDAVGRSPHRSGSGLAWPARRPRVVAPRAHGRRRVRRVPRRATGAGLADAGARPPSTSATASRQQARSSSRRRSTTTLSPTRPVFTRHAGSSSHGAPRRQDGPRIHKCGRRADHLHQSGARRRSRADVPRPGPRDATVVIGVTTSETVSGSPSHDIEDIG